MVFAELFCRVLAHCGSLRSETQNSGQTMEQGSSFHLVYSTRQNIPNMLEGKTVFGSQYPEFAPPMEIKDIGKATGYPEILDRGIPPAPR